MLGSSGPILRALDRWEKKGHLPSELAASLRSEVEEHRTRESRQWSQYALAATGGAVLIIAGATFLTWAWPEMGFGGQSVTLGIVGLFILAVGFRLHRMGSLGAVAFPLLMAGPVLILLAIAYSENAWDDGSLGGILSGVLALVVPLVLVGYYLRKDPVIAALQAAFSFLFFFLFLDRTFGLSQVTCLWILDGVLLAGLVYLAFRVRDPKEPEWVLNLFMAFLYVTPVLLVFTGELVWNLDERVIYPLDLWLITVAGLSLWALQDSAPVHLPKDWYERQLAYGILVGIPFALMTTLEVLDTSPHLAALSVAVIGGLGLWFAIPRGSRPVLITSCIALLIAAWYYGAEMAGALGAVVALTVMSGVLFFGASRIRGGTEQHG